MCREARLAESRGLSFRKAGKWWKRSNIVFNGNRDRGKKHSHKGRGLNDSLAA